MTRSTQYIYDGNRVIQERVSGTPTVAYTRGIDLSGSMEGAGGIGGLLARSSSYASGNFTNHNYYHADGNGNVTYLVNSGQTMAASYRYDSFGKILSALGILSTDNTYRFSSKEVLVNSGLSYYGYRLYDPNLQKWLNKDPFGDESSFSAVMPGSEVLNRKWKSFSVASESADSVTGTGDDGRFALRRAGNIVTSMEGLP